MERKTFTQNQYTFPKYELEKIITEHLSVQGFYISCRPIRFSLTGNQELKVLVDMDNIKTE